SRPSLWTVARPARERTVWEQHRRQLHSRISKFVYRALSLSDIEARVTLAHGPRQLQIPVGQASGVEFDGAKALPEQLVHEAQVGGHVGERAACWRRPASARGPRPAVGRAADWPLCQPGPKGRYRWQPTRPA